MHFIYDKTIHQTVAVCRADIEPDALLPSSEDSVSIQLQWQSIMAGHDLKSYPLLPGAYAEALALYHQGEELLLHLDKFDPKEMDRARAKREAVRKSYNRRITEGTKSEVVSMFGRGFKKSQIAQRLGISTASVSTILKKAADTQIDDPEAA